MVAPAPVFTLRYPFDVAQVEVAELRGDGALAATVPITDFLRLTRLEFGAIENESEPAWNVRLSVTNTSDQPLVLDLSDRFFALEDDQGRKAELVYFCCDSTTGEILDAGQRREIQLMFRSVDGWYGKATSAGSIYLRVTGFSPLARASWRFPTLATAD